VRRLAFREKAAFFQKPTDQNEVQEAWWAYSVCSIIGWMCRMIGGIYTEMIEF
jgi:hypothetical protein